MSWWNATSGFGNLASQALKNAQQKIDKVLDIQGENAGESGSVQTKASEVPTSSSPPPGEDTQFWNEWLAKDKLPTLGSKGKATGTPKAEPDKDVGGEEEWSSQSFSSEFFSSTISSSLSKVQSLKKKAENTSLLRKKSDAELGDRLSLGKINNKRASGQAGSVEKEGATLEVEKSLTESAAPASPKQESEVQNDQSIAKGTDHTDGPKDSDPPTTPVTEPLQISLPHSPQLSAQSGGTGLLTTDTTLTKLNEHVVENSIPDATASTSEACVPADQHQALDPKGKQESEVTEEYSEESLLAETEPDQSGWGDVSLSIITDSQISSASSATVDTTDMVTVTKESLPHNVTKLEAAEGEGCPPVQRDQVADGTVPATEVHETDNMSAATGSSTKTELETGSDSNAWDISELTESALDVEATVTIEESSHTTCSDSVKSKDVDEDIKSTETDAVPQAVVDHASVDVEAKTEVTDIAPPVVEVTEDLPGESKDVKQDSEDSLPASMEDSSDTQEELSEGNRTLTAEEFNQARVSSESSQATLELSPEDEEERKEEELNTKPDTDSSLPEHGQSCDKEKPETRSQTELATSKDNLTSSSYVKTMLEEAMVESLKDTDSHTDSHSSSDMVRIESGPTSGHTSADEIETNTSSDIEIISHISTPTPNGENRLFDLSPLRHALSRTMRRNSPPGHKRSDSSSSGQSRNGDDVLSPDGVYRPIDSARASRETKRESRKTEEQASNALETEKLLKKLAETAEILDVREKKLVDLSRENMELVETVNILRQQLEQSEEAREAEMTDLNTLTEEFTKRMGEAEKKIQSVIREKELMRKKLQDTEGELAKRANDKATERIMREKDQQIAELLEEGEKLSKQQLQSNNIIKKLRVKEKENDSLLKSQKQKLDQQDTEIEKLQTVLDNKVDNEKKQNDAISQLNNAVLKQESEINRLKSELEDSVEKIRSMQVALDNSYKEIGDLHKANAARASQAQEEALSTEIKARKDLQVALEHYQQQAKYEQEALITQIEDHQLNINRSDKEHARREDILRQEIANLQQRLQDAEDRNQELTQSVTQATRPLLRQIENLQSTYAAQVNSYEKVEKNLTERLSESQTQLALALEKERMANDRVIEVDVKLSTLESQVSTLRQDKSRLQASLEMEKAKLEVLEDAKNNEVAQLEALRLNYEQDISELKKDKVMFENQLEMERMKTEAEKKKVIMLHEQLREKELQWVQARKAANSPTPTGFSRESSFTVESPMNLSEHEEVLEKTLMLASANGNKSSLYESLRQAGATTIIESLQSQLKMKDGEVLQLQTEIQELERTRESMARELVSLSNMNDELQEQVQEFPEYQAKHKDLDQRYQALLQMYGEKVEEAEELRLDLQDIKDMYKTQINELLKNQ